MRKATSLFLALAAASALRNISDRHYLPTKSITFLPVWEDQP